MSASSTVPESKLLGRRKSKRIHRFSPWLLLPVALMLITMGLLIWQLRQAGASSATTSTATVTRGLLALSVTGSGTVEAAQSRSLSFRVSGTVDTVLVQQGDLVKSGQPLARLDTRELNLAVQEAEANLKSAEAQLADVQGNGATDLELANARAGLASAEASYANTRNGSATPEDIASARAQLHSAQLSLAELKAGPTSTEISSARTTLEKA
ncbi:MAG: biotin/lipoyl-binding protein, partial [Oscillochloris sp.]|nr:biotin/lipoyl-binding protein [Oscillochloris sp.]